MPIGEEICYLNDDWINVSDVVLVDSKNDTNIAERHDPYGMVRLIKDPSDKALEIIRVLKDKYTDLCRVTVFLESTNFLTTHDKILSEMFI